MIELCIDGKKSYSLPENWQEVINAGKMVQLVEALLIAEPIERNKLRVLSILCEGFNGYELGKAAGAGNKKERKKLSDKISLQFVQGIVDQVFPVLDFIYTSAHFYTNPLPIVKIGDKEYKCCEERLVNQTGEQWQIAFHAQTLFSATNDERHLRALMASCFVPVINGKPIQFSDENFTTTLSEFESLSIAQLNTFLMWYIHADRWWMEKFPWLFPEGEEKEENEPVSENDGLTIRNIIYQLAGNRPTSEWDTVKKRTRQEIVYALDRLEEERLELERINKP